METLRNEPVIMTGNGGMGGYGYGLGHTDLFSPLLLGAALSGNGLFGSKGYGPTVVTQGYQPAMVDMGTLINQQGQSDIRRDVTDSTSEIRESIHEQTIANAAEARSIQQSIDTASRESLASKYEAQIAVKDSTVALTNKVDCESNAIKGLQFQTQVSLDKHFADLNHRIDRRFAELTEKELQRENSLLRSQNEALRDRNQNNDLLTAIAALLKAQSTTP